MRNTINHPNHRELCAARDKEFRELYAPTLDAMLAAGVPHARHAAAVFTIHNGHPRYHVDLVNAYRRVCHMLKAEEKHRHNARTYDPLTQTGLCNERLRRQMWAEITERVRPLIAQGMSVEQAVDHVLTHCRASRFFITPSTALTKICINVRTRALR